MKTKLLIIITISVAMLAGCTGVNSNMTGGYKFEEVYGIGLFTPTYQYKKVSKCQVVEGRTVEPCSPIGKEFTLDMAGPAAPAVLSGASSVVTGAIISDGLSDSGTSVNTVVNSAGDTINGNQHGHGNGNGHNDD